MLIFYLQIEKILWSISVWYKYKLDLYLFGNICILQSSIMLGWYLWQNVIKQTRITNYVYKINRQGYKIQSYFLEAEGKSVLNLKWLSWQIKQTNENTSFLGLALG